MNTAEMPFDDVPGLRPDDYVPELSPTPFKITDVPGAAWVGKRLAAVRAERADVQTAYEQTMDQWITWRDREDERLMTQEDHWLSLLASFFYRYQESHPKAKSLKAPGVSMGTRAQQPEYALDDPALFVEWAKKEAPTLVKATWSPDMTAIKAARSIGVDIPGLDVVDRPPKFYAKTEDAADGD